MVLIARVNQPHVECRLAGIRHDLEHVIFALFGLLGQVFGAPDQRALRENHIAVIVGLALTDECCLIRRPLYDDVGGLTALDLRKRELFALRGELRLDVVIGDDVGKTAVPLHQLGHVHELGEPAVELVLARWRKLPIGHDFAEHACPGIEVRYAHRAQRLLVEITLDREHFGHGVGERRTA
ncbi:hypothetical protein D3C87_1190640 [compost metagenome]